MLGDICSGADYQVRIIAQQAVFRQVRVQHNRRGGRHPYGDHNGGRELTPQLVGGRESVCVHLLHGLP